MNGLPENQELMSAQNAIVRTGIESGKYKEIPLTQGKATIVDAEDYEWLNQWKWCANKRGHTYYATRGYWNNGKIFHVDMHRLILGLTTGDGILVDHASRNGLHNWRNNLRISDKSRNGVNAKLRTHNTSGYRGVSWNKLHQKWQAYLGHHGRIKHCGYFNDAASAAMAFDRMAIKYRAEDAILNFPEKREEYEQLIRRNL